MAYTVPLGEDLELLTSKRCYCPRQSFLEDRLGCYSSHNIHLAISNVHRSL